MMDAGENPQIATSNRVAIGLVIGLRSQVNLSQHQVRLTPSTVRKGDSQGTWEQPTWAGRSLELAKPKSWPSARHRPLPVWRKDWVRAIACSS